MRFFMLFFLMLFLTEDIEVIGTYEDENYTMVYGSYNHDPYVMAYDNQSLEIYFELTYPLDYDTHFTYLADVGEGYFLIIEGEKTNIIIYINDQGDIIDTHHLEVVALSYHNHHDLLVVEIDDGSRYIDSEFHIYDEIERDMLIDDLTPLQYQGILYVNKVMSETLDIDGFGHYDIEIVDGSYRYRYERIYLPKNIYYNGTDDFNLLQDVVLYEPIQVFSEADDLFLNQMPYEHEWIDQTGQYQLDVYHDGFMYQSLQFTIYPKLEGFEEGQVKEQSFYAFGDIYLNQKPISGYCYIDGVGFYDLRVYFDGEMIEEYQFEILENEKTHSYIFVIIIAISGVIVLIILFKK